MQDSLHSPLRRPLTALALALTFSATAEAQVSPGHRLFSPRPGTDTFLVDNQGEIVHTWPSDYSVGTSVYMKPNGNLLRSILTPSTVAATALNGEGGGVQEQTFDGTVVWDYRYDTNGNLLHHDMHHMPNGNVLMMAWEEFTEAEAIAAGRDLALASGLHFPDHLIEVQPTGPNSGTIVWEWHAWDHMVQDYDPTKANFGVVADHPELIDINYPHNLPGGELHHLNGLDYDPVNDLIIMSARTQNEVWIIDHSTTTAEAAGHTGGNYGKGGDLLYRWGNPEAYDRGDASDRTLFFQHDPRFIPPGYPGAGNLTIFNNQAPGGTEVIEIDLPQDLSGAFTDPGVNAYGPAAPVWSYSDPGNFDSGFMSSAERLRNGNTLICSSIQGRIFEIDSSGTILWEHSVPSGIMLASFHSHYYERTLWQEGGDISASAGGTVEFEVVAGSQHGGDAYMLVGTLAGTSPGFNLHGFHVPLNVDVYFRYMLGIPAGPYHTGNFGLLDANGRASASFEIPPGLAMAGLTFDHAVLMAHPFRLRLTGVTGVETFSTTP